MYVFCANKLVFFYHQKCDRICAIEWDVAANGKIPEERGTILLQVQVHRRNLRDPVAAVTRIAIGGQKSVVRTLKP